MEDNEYYQINFIADNLDILKSFDVYTYNNESKSYELLGKIQSSNVVDKKNSESHNHAPEYEFNLTFEKNEGSVLKYKTIDINKNAIFIKKNFENEYNDLINRKERNKQNKRMYDDVANILLKLEIIPPNNYLTNFHYKNYQYKTTDENLINLINEKKQDIENNLFKKINLLKDKQKNLSEKKRLSQERQLYLDKQIQNDKKTYNNFNEDEVKKIEQEISKLKEEINNLNYKQKLITVAEEWCKIEVGGKKQKKTKPKKTKKQKKQKKAKKTVKK
jgi:hypothetical protein